MTTKYRNAVSRNVALPGAAALALFAATSMAAHAGGPGVERVSSLARHFGERALSVEGARTIIVTPETRSVQVQPGETVRFDFGTTSAGWSFAARAGNAVVELINLFPEIPAAEGVWVHQDSSRVYRGVLAGR